MIDENVEKKLLDAVRNEEDTEQYLMGENSWPVLCHLSAIRENILDWYAFEPQASLLEIGSECGALTGLFCRKVARVVAVEPSERDSAVNLARNRQYGNLTVLSGDFCDMEIREKFDYVTVIGSLGSAGRRGGSENPYLDMLRKAKGCLKEGGRLFLAIGNRYGLKYFAGAAEDHTGRCFDGLENYAAAGEVRTFSRGTLQKMLLEAGYSRSMFYYPMPDYMLPSEIYSDNCLPSPGSIRYPCVAYDRDRYEVLDERLTFDSICADGMFGDFANSFLVIGECGKCCGPDEGTVVYAKYNRQRAPEFRVSTKIISGADGVRYVEKKALCPEAVRHVERFSENREKLTRRNLLPEASEAGAGVPVPVELLSNENGRAVFPCVEGTSLAKEVNAGLWSRETFLKAMHRAVDSIYGTFLNTGGHLADFAFTGAFEEIFGISAEDPEAEILRRMKSPAVSNIDSILSNFIRQPDGSLVCLDYEWVFDFPVPAEYLIYRTVFYYYSENVHYIRVSEPELWAEFGLDEEQVNLFRKMDDHFQQYVHGKDRKYMYTANYAKKTINIGSNLKNGERWFLSIADDIQELNIHLGGFRRDLVECRVKTHRKSVFRDRCERKAAAVFRRIARKLKKTREESGTC